MILKTERLCLRPWRKSDAESLFTYAKDPAIGPACGWPPHQAIEDSRYAIEHILTGSECYAVTETGKDEAIGCIELKTGKRTDLTDKDDEGELGFWIGRPFWGKGYITEAVRELARRAFTELSLSCLWCAYYDGNNQSKRVQEKSGFRYRYTVAAHPVPLLGKVMTMHVNRLTKEEWINGQH